MRSIKAMRVYEIATLLISVLWLVGCSAPVRDWNSSSNPAMMRSPLSADRATARLVYVSNRTEKTVHRFAMDGATKAVTAAADRLGWCCPAVSEGEGRAAGASCESCAWKMQVVRYEIVLLWRSLHSDAVGKDEMCRLDPL